jgi:hypothetical protein
MFKLAVLLISLICLCFSETRLLGIAALVVMCYFHPWVLILLMALALGGWFVKLKLS